MPHCETKYFGSLEFGCDSAIHFPLGIPGFEDERDYVLIEQSMNRPLAFLQSIRNADLCFLVVPTNAIQAQYNPTISHDDLEALGLPSRQPAAGTDVLYLAILTVTRPGEITANLLAPLVINLRTRIAVQAVQVIGIYSHRHALHSPESEPVCS